MLFQSKLYPDGFFENKEPKPSLTVYRLFVDRATACMDSAEILSHMSLLVLGLVGMWESWPRCHQKPEGTERCFGSAVTHEPPGGACFGVSVSQIYNREGFIRDLSTWKHSDLWERPHRWRFPVLT